MSDALGGLVVLLRHGRTAWNLEHRFQGQHDTDLDEVGAQQAGDAAAALADALGPRRVELVSSDLSRAHATAQALASALAVPVRLDPRLREIDAGRWQGLLPAEIQAQDPTTFAAWQGGDDVVLGGGERPSEAGARVRAAVSEHAAGVGTGQVLVVVGHGASIRAGASALLGQPGLRRLLVPLGNTATALLGGGPVPAGAWRLHGWNVPPGGLGAVLGRGSGLGVGASLAL